MVDQFCLTAQPSFTKTKPWCAQKLGGSIALHKSRKRETTAALRVCRGLSLRLNQDPQSLSSDP